MNFSSLKAAIGQAVQQAAVTAKDLSAQVVGAKILRDYSVKGQVASAGPACLWKIYTATARSEGAANKTVSVWILDKRIPQDSQTLQNSWETFLGLCRKDAAKLAKLKHPGVVTLVEPFEETRSQMVMVTEPIFASMANVITQFEGLPAEVRAANAELKLSPLEVKHGLLQVADGLHFLHSEANLIHRAINPATLMLTASGAWKIAGFGFATMAEFNTSHPENQPFTYDDANSPIAIRVLQPPLQYTAPELVAGGAATPGTMQPAADIFSLGTVVYEMLTVEPLLPGNNSVVDYRARLAGLGFMDMPGVGPQLVPVLRAMLSGVPSARPPATAFTGAQYFQEDVALRALRFLDSMLQRDNLQKAAFLKDLAGFVATFDARVLRYKVLPPLLAELRNESLQGLVLPLVLDIIARQDPAEFAEFTAPALAPLCASAKGETLAMLTRNAPLLARNLPSEAVNRMVVPLLCRAADAGDAGTQEEMVKVLPGLVGVIEYGALKAEVLPRVAGLCLGTTSAAVRIHSLLALGKLLPRLDRDEAAKVLALTGKVTGVDKSAATLMCVLGLGTAISKQWGPEMTAELVLPVLTPLLVAKSLSEQQFATALRIVKELLAMIEVKRTGELKGTEVPIELPQVSAKDAAAASASAAMLSSAAPKPSPPKASGWGSMMSRTGKPAAAAASTSSLAPSLTPAVAVPSAAAMVDTPFGPTPAAASATPTMPDFTPSATASTASFVADPTNPFLPAPPPSASAPSPPANDEMYDFGALAALRSGESGTAAASVASAAGANTMLDLDFPPMQPMAGAPMKPPPPAGGGMGRGMKPMRPKASPAQAGLAAAPFGGAAGLSQADPFAPAAPAQSQQFGNTAQAPSSSDPFGMFQQPSSGAGQSLLDSNGTHPQHQQTSFSDSLI